MCTHSGTCNPATGVCRCPRGWSGDDCSIAGAVDLTKLSQFQVYSDLSFTFTWVVSAFIAAVLMLTVFLHLKRVFCEDKTGLRKPNRSGYSRTEDDYDYF